MRTIASAVERHDPALAKTLTVMADLQEVMGRRKAAVVGGESSTSFLTGVNALPAGLADTFMGHMVRHVLSTAAGGLAGSFMPLMPQIAAAAGAATAGAVSLFSDARVANALSQMLHDPKLAKVWMTKASEGNWSMFPKSVKWKLHNAGFVPNMIVQSGAQNNKQKQGAK
jgi:hypothetical protein